MKYSASWRLCGSKKIGWTMFVKMTVYLYNADYPKDSTYESGAQYIDETRLLIETYYNILIER